MSLDPFEIVGFAKARALAPEDIHPYDQKANGMLAGEGCGIVVLAREEYARKLGYKIHALIRGWGYSSDGTGGITSPEIEGQMRALNNAYKRAGYPISDVELFEGHGTGTTLGDKVEITALRRSIEQSGKNGICRIGSIKANIGHCKAAAGIAGFIKVVMALNRKVLPPTVNCKVPNAAFGDETDGLVPNLQGQPWLKNGAKPRRASVSSMGFGGANSHITLEESNPESKPLKKELRLLHSHQDSELILISGETSQDLIEKIEHLIPISERICRAELTDVSAALLKKLIPEKLRVAIIAPSP